VVEAIDAGADWDVAFAPFSLSQSHVEPGEPDVWDHPDGAAGARGVAALEWAIAVRDEFPDLFAPFHVRLFDARHSDGADVDDAAVLRTVSAAVGLDADLIARVVETGRPRKTLAAEHQNLVDQHAVFGVPTFIAAGEAVFVRLMERHEQSDLQRVLDMVEWSRLNEFKRTRIPR
jgi:predicted DsbA family dithiol-disulfide isomerase